MKRINIPKVQIPKRGLYDLFLGGIASAVHMKKEEAEKLFNIK